MPPTIHALLGARIERLEPQQCAILERAAVVGRQFSRSAVAALLPSDGASLRATASGEASGLDAQLESLQRAQLIERDTGWLLGEPVLRFHHVLIRDAAYRRLLKGTRAELHERLASWIEERVGDAPEHDETIGRHLEEAHRLLGELGPIDDEGWLLGERAATRLAAAGRRALEGDDVQLAAGLLGRALDRLKADDPGRADLAIDWCESELAAGDVTGAAAAIEELGRLAEGSDRLHAWHACFVGHHTVLTAPRELSATVEMVAAAATSLASLNDAAGEAKGHFVHALALARLGKVGPCEASLDQALAAARRAGDRRRANTVLALAPLAALWGPSPVTRASGRCLDVVRVLRITQGAPAVEAVALSCQGVLEALRGRTEAAHRMIASARTMVEELGITHRVLETDVSAGLVALLEGDAAAAERSLRAAYEGLRDLGLGIDAARAAALLARALLAQGRVEEAEALSHESEALAGDDLKAAIAWRGVRAEALARRGEHAVAVALASKAVELAAATDALLDHADARLALAAALRAAGRGGDAGAEERLARDLWQAKGATVLADGAPLAPAPVAPPAAAPGRRAALARRRRPVRPNFAIEETRRIEAAVAARDVQAVENVYRRDVEIVDHQHGLEYGHDAIFERVRAVIEESTEGSFHHEALATLGDFVVLCRLSSTASGSVVYGVPLGATEVTSLLVIEADEQGCARRIDVFGEDAIGDAVVRLYERHAALLPEGAARTRAAATARSMAVLRSANADPELLAPVLAPDVEGVDHRHLSNWSLRGAPAYLDHLRALHQVADDVDFRWGEILALSPDALLTRTLHRGTERVGGGAYERPFLSLFVVGADGRITRAEWFDDDREAEALGRFDALAVSGRADRPVQRRIRPNAATRSVERFAAALEARDAEALPSFFDESLRVAHHPSAATYGRREMLATWRSALKAERLHFRREAVATLGDGLVLSRQVTTVEGLREAYLKDFGSTEVDEISLIETDAGGRWLHVELFGPDRLGDAIHRLFERHAELLPEGPARERAATAAHVVRMSLTPFDADAAGALVDQGIEFVDHRNLGSWDARGAQAVKQHTTALHDVARGAAVRHEDILALEPGALLVRLLHSGTARVGGGLYERQYHVLVGFGPDGRLKRVEFFDVGDEARALARFDELTADSADRHAAQPPLRRALRPNAATEVLARMESAAAARDFVTLRAVLDDDYSELDHPTGSSFGADEAVASVERLFRSRDPYFRYDAVATLGRFLYLGRRRAGASGATGRRFDVGEYENAALQLYEADERGRMRRSEAFAVDRLGDAIVRLYERHAAQQPEGPARTRAAGVARAVAAWTGSTDPDVLATAIAPSAALVDHRVLATWSARDAAELLRHFRLQRELAPDFACRVEDVLAVEPHAFLFRTTYHGTDRTSGGSFENRVCVLFVCGDDGRVAHIAAFEAESEAEALARFDALAADASDARATQRPARRAVRANAATRISEGCARAIAARDAAALKSLLAEDLRVEHQPTGASFTRREFMITWRSAFEARHLESELEVIASLGQTLDIHRYQVAVEGMRDSAMTDFGRSELAGIVVVAADARGRCRRMDLFGPEKLGDAIVRLYESHAESLPEGRERARTAGIARALAAFNGPIDPEGVAAAYEPASRNVDHRLFGTWTTSSAAEMLRHFRHQLELAPDFAARFEDVLALEPDALLARMSFFGTGRDSGGAFENRILVLFTFGDDGRLGRTEVFEAEQGNEALARFDELGGSAGASPSPADRGLANAATRLNDRFARAWAAHDWDVVEALQSPTCELEDRRRVVQMESRLDHFRLLFDTPGSRYRVTPIATRGGRLALSRVVFEGLADHGGGQLAIDSLNVDEVDDDGHLTRVVMFDLDDVDAAYTELDARFEAEQGECLPASWTILRRWIRAVADRDWEGVASLCADDLVERDHRSLSLLGVTRGVEPWIQVLRTVSDLAPDSVFRVHHFIPGARGYYEHGGFYGTREGGPFEIVIDALVEIDDRGLLKRIDLYDDDRVFASSRWSELGIPVPSPTRESAALDAPGPTVAEPNAASAAADRWVETYRIGFETGNWKPMREVCAPGFVYSDRQRMVLLEGDVELLLASVRERAATGARVDLTSVGTAGDRVNIQRVLWSGGPADGRFEVEYLAVTELDESGLVAALLLFDPDDGRAAQREAWARWIDIDPDVAAVLTPVGNLPDAFNEKSAAKWRAAFADDLVVEDHRLAGMGRIEGADAYTDSIVALWKLAPLTRADIGWRWLALDRHGAITVVHRTGTVPEGGGDFESEHLWLCLVAQGRITRVELFEMSALATARARFAELAAGASPDPLARIAGPNAASLWLDRFRLPFNARNWSALHALFAPAATYEDRQRHSLVAGGLDMLLSSVRARAEAGFLVERVELLGTAGRRVAIQRVQWAGGGDQDRVDVEFIVVQEVDDAGRLRASINFDPDDGRAVQREAWARWAAIEPEMREPLVVISGLTDRFNDGDRAEVRALCADDLFAEDHRRTGIGRIDGVDAYMESLVALWDLAPDQRLDLGWHWPAYGPHGGVTAVRRFGTLPDGGAFESEYLEIFVVAHGRATHLELFELEDLDAALARFEELRPRSSDTTLAP